MPSRVRPHISANSSVEISSLPFISSILFCVVFYVVFCVAFGSSCLVCKVTTFFALMQIILHFEIEMGDFYGNGWCGAIIADYKLGW